MSERAENIIRADAVVAQNFVLVDQDDEERAKLTTTTDGEVVMNFYDAQGNPRIVFAAYNEGNAMVSLVDNGQKERVRISSGVNGNAITIFDREQRTRLLLQLDSEADGAEIHMVDETGNPQIILTQIGRDQDNPSPLIVVKDPSGRFREV